MAEKGRKMTENRPVIALMYDFDKTLCTKDMQEYTFIPKVNMSPDAFWGQAIRLSQEKKMDPILAYMWLMIDKARSEHVSIHRENFVEMGKDLELFPGVEDWFRRIDEEGRAQGIEIEHYIISSGLREIIEGSSVYGNFRDVFACEFYYDENDVAVWPKNVVNYTTKTQFLFRINKGILDLSENSELNAYTPEEERRIPFENMIYVGDGLTDVPCMKLVKVHGGYSIAVHKPGERVKVESLIRDGRVDFITEADYTEGSEMDETVKRIIRGMAVRDCLRRQSLAQLKSVSE